VLFASGVEWRRLDVAGIDDLLGAGVYHEAGPNEALACTDSRVVVVGGGDSAGQAVVRFSRYARQVTLLSAAAISARRCRSTSSISCRASRTLMCGCARRW
jgi:thioredoxin reductase